MYKEFLAYTEMHQINLYTQALLKQVYEVNWNTDSKKKKFVIQFSDQERAYQPLQHYKLTKNFFFSFACFTTCPKTAKANSDVQIKLSIS